jgi:agmatine deiminase
VDRAQIEHMLREYLCATEVIWLPGGPMAGDDTDGHVDQLARFVDPRRVAVALAGDPFDENFAPLQANVACLEARNRQNPAAPLEIIPLPLPRPLAIDGQRVPASYCNFYIANGCVLMPAFDDPADDMARDILQSVFADREVIPLAARDLIWGLGALHCMTQQQPAA